MKKSKIAIILMSFVLVVAISVGLMITSSAYNYGFFSKDDIDSESYAYSMAVVGDTQTLVYSDVQNSGKDGYEPRLEKIYDWIIQNKDNKKISMVLGLGDITETWNEAAYPDDFKAEWELAVSEISKLNGKIPYTLVRGNHDTESGFDKYIGGMTGYTSQFTGDSGAFMAEGSYSTSYRKITIAETKWLIVTLDWAPTGAELDWAADVIKNNSDYSVILTMHDYLYHDMTLDGEGDSADTAKHNPDWDDSIDPTDPNNDPNLVYNPDGIWARLVSKHANIKLVLSGHVTNSHVVHSQVIGDAGNTVTQMLVDPQSMDLDRNNAGGCGMVCMLYFKEDGTLANDGKWDGKTVDVEWYSTIKNQYYKDVNQFTLDLNLYDGGTPTEKYGIIPKAYINAEEYPFVTFGYDDDTDKYFFHSAHKNWTTAEMNGAYLSLSDFSGKDVPAYILLRRDFNAIDAGDVRYTNFGNMSCTLNLDLGGNEFTSTVYVFDANMKKASKSTLNIYGKEGSAFIVGGAQPLFWLGTNADAASGAEFTYNFEGIRFAYADTATARSMICASFNKSGSSSVATTQNINFSDCIFDLTNKPSSAVTMLQLNETVGADYYVTSANVKINGGSIIANDLTDVTLYSANDTDSVIFGDGKEGALTLTLPKGEAVPDYTCYGEDGKPLSFELKSEGADANTYALAKKSAADKGTIDVWLIGGQSNAVGYGTDTLSASLTDSRYSTGFENVLFYGQYESNYCPDTFVPVKMGLGKQGTVTTTVGAEIGMASVLGDSDGMHAIIKRAHGASYLYPNTAHTVSQNYGTWTSPTYIANNNISTEGNKIGELYNSFIDTVAYGIEMLVEEGYTPVIRGMWWMQGEAETGTQVYANSYVELLTALISDVRNDLGEITGDDLSDMPFVMGKITRNQEKLANGDYVYSQPTYLEVVNNAQISVTFSVENTFIVDTTGLRQLDGWHYSADGQHYIGEQFINTVISSEGKFSVTLEGSNVTLTGGGAKSSGESVTVIIKAAPGCVITSVKYAEGENAGVEIELGESGEYTFTMPNAPVVFEVLAEDPNAVATEYGIIPSMYSSGAEYPFILFMDGKIVGAYTGWTQAAVAATNLVHGTAAEGKALQILLRADYETESISGVSFAYVGGTVLLDLDGFTLTSGEAQIFNALGKSTDGSVHDTAYIIKNGRVNIKGGPVIAFNNVSNDEYYTTRKNFYFTFEGVTFGLAEGYETWHGMIVDCYDNGDVGSNGYITLNNCTVDLKTVEPTKTLNIFDLADTGNKNNIYVTVNGGSFNVSDSFDNYVSIFAANEANAYGKECVSFAKDTAGNYPVFNSDVDLGYRPIYNENGKHLEMILTENTSYSYTLSEVPEDRITEYGIIPSGFESVTEHPFVIFQGGDFYKAYQTYYEFLTDIKTTPLTVESVLYLRRDYTIDTSSGDTKSSNNDRNLNCLKAHLTIDLNEKTLTRGNLHALQIMGNGNNLSITVKNGILHTKSGTMIPFNNTGSSANKETVTYVFEDVTFTTASGLTKPFVDAYTGGTDAGTSVNMTFTDCVFDITGLGTASSSTYLFDLNEVDTNKIDFNITINGGGLVAKSLTKIGFATYSDERADGAGSPDKITFKPYGTEEFYLHLPSGVGTISKNVDTTDGLMYFVEEYDDGNTSFCYLRSLETSYGSISTSNISALDYPFILFQDGAMANAYGTWYNFLAATPSIDWSKESVLVLRRDYSTTECGKNSSNLYNVGELLIDLGGNTFTRGNYHMFQAIRMGDDACHVDITVINGVISVEKSWAVPIAFNTYTDKTFEESDVRFDFTFNNVTFTSSSAFGGRMVAEAYSNGAYGSKNKLVFNGCTFDIVSSGVEKLFQLNENEGSNKFDISVEINGGKIIDSNSEAVSIATLSEERVSGEGSPDSVRFGRFNGEYTVLVYTSASSAVVFDFVSVDGSSMSPAKTAGQSDTYQLGEDVYTKYGYIPFSYSDAELYPFVVFVGGKFGAAFDCWADNTGKDCVLSYANGKNSTVLLRRDYTAESGSGSDSFSNFTHIANITLDLGGNTYTGASRAVFQAQAKTTGSAGVIDTYVYVLNGKFLVDKEAVVQFNHANFDTYNRAENFYFTFTNVEFGFVSGSVADGLVCNTVEYSNTGEIGCLPSIVVNDCIFRTKTGTAIFNLDDGKDLVNGNVTINGGTIISDGFAETDIISGSANDKAVFVKDVDGNYTSLELPHGIEVSDVEFDGLVFVKISDNGETVTYRLRLAAVAGIDFVPKMSLTLDRDLVLNVYIPAKEFLLGFTLDGKSDEELGCNLVTLGTEEYYHAVISLSAKEAAREVVLAVTVSVEEKTATGRFTFGIIKYAEQILADGSTEEKTLVSDVLSYIRAAYKYFSVNDAATVSRIDAILGDGYDTNNAPEFVGSSEAPTTGLSSVTFVLDATPTVRFYLASGADANAYKFYIDGVLVNTVIGVKDDLTYIDLDTYAYAVCETVTYTISGVESGSFDINAYYEWAKGQNDSDLVNLVERFAKYSESAKAYRDSVISE